MHRSMPYNYWKQDSELYPHVKASTAERLQGTTGYGQSTFQPHQNFPHSIPENSHSDSTLVVPQHHIAYDRDSTTNDHALTRDDVLDASVLSIPALPSLDQGKGQLVNIQSCAAGWHPHHVPSGYWSPHAFPDYLSAHNMGFSDTNLTKSWSITSMQGLQHDPRHQFQEEVCPHPRYAVKDDESESHVVGHTCEWNDGYGTCGRTINAARTGEHMLSYHFKSPLPADSRLECLWEGCQLQKPVRRDTIIRHIIEKHIGLKYRRKLGMASRAGAGFCQSSENARLHR